MALKETTADKYEMEEHKISKEQNQADLRSQECVEDRSKRSNMTWVSVRNNHNRFKDDTPINRWPTHQCTCGEAAIPSNE